MQSWPTSSLEGFFTFTIDKPNDYTTQMANKVVIVCGNSPAFYLATIYDVEVLFTFAGTSKLT